MTTTKVKPSISLQAEVVLEKRYYQPGEDAEKMFERVAKGVAEFEIHDKEKWADVFYDMMATLDFLPNSPTLMNAGTGRGTLSACYVLPLGDSMEEIMQTAADQAMVEKFGGGVGFPLSNLRPKGIKIASTQGFACGPIAVLKHLSSVGTMITQGGKRDGAHMAVMSVYHPDVLEFIECKTVEGEISNFNISVGVDSNFMRAVQNDEFVHLAWPLCKETTTYRIDPVTQEHEDEGEWVSAVRIFDKIVAGAWKNGEPGMLWLDRMNEDNATPHISAIEATNPCGEQPLLANESCNLGSLNLGNFVIDSEYGLIFDFARFEKRVADAVRFLDDIIDANNHPTDATREMNKRTRKIGLGVMGWADALVKLGIAYDSDEAISLGGDIACSLQNVADTTSRDLGTSKGSFPEFAKSTLNAENGGQWAHMRNAWRLSIAPTGTLSMIADCSGGIEPLFDIAYMKKNLSAALEGDEFLYINEDLRKEIPDIDARVEAGKNVSDVMTLLQKKVYVTTNDISPVFHVKMQATWQKHVDSGISKTINMAKDVTEQDVYAVYMDAWASGCKGITVYREGSREKEVLVSVLPEEKVERASRPEIMSGKTHRVNTGHGKLYVTINEDDEGKPFEVFTSLGTAGQCEPASLEAMSKLASLALRVGVPVEEVVDQFKGISCCPVWDNGTLVKSIPDAIASVLKEKEVKIISTKIETGTICKDCGSNSIYFSEGCSRCAECGWSMCG